MKYLKGSLLNLLNFNNYGFDGQYNDVRAYTQKSRKSNTLFITVHSSVNLWWRLSLIRDIYKKPKLSHKSLLFAITITVNVLQYVKFSGVAEICVRGGVPLGKEDLSIVNVIRETYL